METVTLAEIVKTFVPNWSPILTSKELNSKVVLQKGLASLNTEDVLEIIEASIKHINGSVYPVH